MGGIPVDLSSFRHVFTIFDRIPPVWSRFSRPGPVQTPGAGPRIPVPDCPRPLAYLCEMQVREKWTKKRPPEGLGRVSGLGELDFCLVEGSEIPQGLRIEPIGDRPGLFPGVGAVVGGESLNPGHHVPGIGSTGCDFHADSVSSHGVNK